MWCVCKIVFGYSDFFVALLPSVWPNKRQNTSFPFISYRVLSHQIILIIILLVFISRNDGGRYEIHIDGLPFQCRMKILQDELLVSFTFRTSFSIQLGLGCRHFTTLTIQFSSQFSQFHRLETCRTPQYKEVPQRKLKCLGRWNPGSPSFLRWFGPFPLCFEVSTPRKLPQNGETWMEGKQKISGGWDKTGSTCFSLGDSHSG